jgi:hypothetical protein
MYYTIKGVYRKGMIIPAEPTEFMRDEMEVIITFLNPEDNRSEFLKSDDEILYTMGDRAAEGTFTDSSESHDRYLYRKG